MGESNEWEMRYQTGSTGWDRGRSSHNLNYWLEHGLLQPCRILIPGCGNGYEVMVLAKSGFEVVAIDIAPTAIDNLGNKLRESDLQAELVLGDFLKWNPAEKFDAIFEQTSLCTLPPERWNQYATQLYQWLKPKGKLFAQFIQTGNEDGPPFHCEIKNMSQLFYKDKWLWSKEHRLQEKVSGFTELLYLLEKKDADAQVQ